MSHLKYSASSYTDVAHLVAEDLALSVSSEEKSLTDRQEITRHWPDVPIDEQQQCIELLSIVTSVKNKQVRFWVDEPMMDQQEQSGRWRLVSVGSSKQLRGVQGVFQTLRKGWLKDVDWSEAQLDEGDNQVATTQHDTAKVNAKYHTISWHSIDPSDVDTFVESLRAVESYTEFTVQRYRHTTDVANPWYTLHASPRQDEDGSYTVTLFIAKDSTFEIKGISNKGTPRERTVINIWDMPKHLAQDLIDAKSDFEGASTSVNWDRANSLVDVTISYKSADDTSEVLTIVTQWTETFKETHSYHFGITRAALVALEATQLVNGTTYKVIFVRFNEQEDTWDAITRTVEDIAVTRPDYISQVNSLGATTITELENQLSLPSAIGKEVGKIKSQRITHNDNGNKDIITEERLLTELADADFVDVGGNRLVRKFRKRTRNKTNPSVTAFGSWATGNVHETDYTLNEGGLYDQVEEKLVPQEESTRSREVAPGYTDGTKNTVHGTEVTIPGLPDATKGSILTLRQSIDAFGKVTISDSNRSFNDMTVGNNTAGQGDTEIPIGDDAPIKPIHTKSPTVETWGYPVTARDYGADGTGIPKLVDEQGDPINGSIKVKKGQHGLWDGTIIKSIYTRRSSANISNDDWINTTKGPYVIYRWETQQFGGIPRKRLLRIMFKIRWSADRSNAFGFLNGGLPGSGMTEYGDQYGPSGFKALKVIEISTVITGSSQSDANGWTNNTVKFTLQESAPVPPDTLPGVTLVH